MVRYGLMVERCIAPDRVPVLVDLGSVEDQESRDFADGLMAAGVSKRRFSIEGNRRLLVKLDPRKAPALIEQFQIAEGATYWQCTHHRPGLEG